MNIFRNSIPKTLLVFLLLFSASFSLAQVQPPEEILEVDVAWDKSATQVVTAGNQHVSFSSNGLVERSKLQTVHLTLQTLTGNPVTVCTFDPLAGSRFSVSYPACATGQNFTFVPEVEYVVAFTDEFGNIINSADGDGPYLLPEIPAASLPNNLLEVDSTVLPHPSGGEYYSVTVEVTQTIAGKNFDLFLRTEENAVFVEFSIGTIPITKGVYTLPAGVPQEALPNGTYELIARYNDTNYEVIALSSRIGGGSSGTPSGDPISLGGGMFNSTQEDIMANGLVSDCGYDIRTLSNEDGTGRMCGLADAIILIQRLIEYIFILILPIAAIVFVYVGYLFLTSGGNADKRSKAKKAMLSLVIGIVIIMAAWLIVKTILQTLGVDTSISEQFLDLNT